MLIIFLSFQYFALYTQLESLPSEADLNLAAGETSDSAGGQPGDEFGTKLLPKGGKKGNPIATSTVGDKSKPEKSNKGTKSASAIERKKKKGSKDSLQPQQPEKASAAASGVGVSKLSISTSSGIKREPKSRGGGKAKASPPSSSGIKGLGSTLSVTRVLPPANFRQVKLTDRRTHADGRYYSLFYCRMRLDRTGVSSKSGSDFTLTPSSRRSDRQISRRTGIGGSGIYLEHTGSKLPLAKQVERVLAEEERDRLQMTRQFEAFSNLARLK